MSFYSVVGSLLLLTGGWLWAYRCNQTADARLARVDGMLAMLRYIRSQVDGLALSATEILARCDGALLEACGLSSESRPNELLAFAEQCGKEDKTAWGLMRRFTLEFGGQDRAEQVRKCDACIDRMTERREALARGHTEDRRIRYTVSMTVAAVAAILLW